MGKPPERLGQISKYLYEVLDIPVVKLHIHCHVVRQAYIQTSINGTSSGIMVHLYMAEKKLRRIIIPGNPPFHCSQEKTQIIGLFDIQIQIHQNLCKRAVDMSIERTGTSDLVFRNFSH